MSNFHQTSHGAMCRKGIANLFKRFRAIEQDDRHAHIWYKTFKNLLQNQESFGAESWHMASRTHGLPSLFNDDRRLTFDLFWQGQICIPMHVYGEVVEKSFSQTVLKTNV